MTNEEKIFLIQCLLRDIRGNWADDPTERAKTAKKLCSEVGKNNADFLTLEAQIDEYLADMDYGADGRFFRTNFPYGYESMETLHGLQHTLIDKSKEFQDLVSELITYPEFLFTD